ncbi:hypothetical protein [Paenibacillus sp. OV219]|uniref:hypothetical protein n=1 Tax=Paenibacillus sp. OV219 TaxID=1884377 RepID=UPI0008B3226D|nr:hypothetical protein [Paenibacillus sp. OV219]SEM65462.1 hypothetical protein SAMN05518847_101432 [Paenibacillus sp. OV219]
MVTNQAELVTHDNRKVYPEVYQLKPGPVQILQLPELQYITQATSTVFNMDYASQPEPLDERWVIAKVVNQIKRITKERLAYKFKLMPPEIVWHSEGRDGKYNVTLKMQVPSCVTEAMFEEARACVRKNLRGIAVPETSFIRSESMLCAQRLYVGHYRDTEGTLREIVDFVK